MMRDLGGVDIANMDSNWSRLVCDMTFKEVDALINIVYSVDSLTEQGLTHTVVLVLGGRQLVFQKNRLVRAFGPSESWVRKSGERYAEALLGALEEL